MVHLLRLQLFRMNVFFFFFNIERFMCAPNKNFIFFSVKLPTGNKKKWRTISAATSKLERHELWVQYLFVPMTKFVRLFITNSYHKLLRDNFLNYSQVFLDLTHLLYSCSSSISISSNNSKCTANLSLKINVTIKFSFILPFWSLKWALLLKSNDFSKINWWRKIFVKFFISSILFVISRFFHIYIYCDELRFIRQF